MSCITVNLLFTKPSVLRITVYICDPCRTTTVGHHDRLNSINEGFSVTNSKLFHGKTAVGLFCAATLGLAGCAGGQTGGGQQGESGRSQTEQAQAAEDIRTVDGFYTSPALGEALAEVPVELPFAKGGDEGTARAKLQVLSLDRKDDTVRMVGAWLLPEDGPQLGSRSLAGGYESLNSAPKPVLWDEAAGTLIPPLQTKDAGLENPVGSKLASQTSSKPKAVKSVELFWVDFPAPESSSVRILPSQWIGPTEPVEISENSPFDADKAAQTAEFSNAPPSQYGDSAAKRFIDPVESPSELDPNSSKSKFKDGEALNINADVLFEFDKSDINAKGQKVLSKIADQLKSGASGQKIKLVGHTDAKGSDSYNLALSKKRADAVKKFLEPKVSSAGISFTTEGKGSKQPIEPNFDEDGKDIKENQAKNRRVSLEFSGKAPEGDLSSGEGSEAVPQMKQIDPADGALASAILKNSRSATKPTRVDIVGFSEIGDYTKIDLAYAMAEGDKSDNVFFNEPRSGAMAFGPNGYGSLLAPSAVNIAIVDAEGQALEASRGGGRSCLCTSTAPANRANFPDRPVPMYAMFPSESFPTGEASLRIAKSGEWKINLDELRSKAEQNSSETTGG